MHRGGRALRWPTRQAPPVRPGRCLGREVDTGDRGVGDGTGAQDQHGRDDHDQGRPRPPTRRCGERCGHRGGKRAPAGQAGQVAAGQQGTVGRLSRTDHHSHAEQDKAIAGYIIGAQITAPHPALHGNSTVRGPITCLTGTRVGGSRRHSCSVSVYRDAEWWGAVQLVSPGRRREGAGHDIDLHQDWQGCEPDPPGRDPGCRHRGDARRRPGVAGNCGQPGFEGCSRSCRVEGRSGSRSAGYRRGGWW